MERPRQLFRDYGLTLALLLAATLIYWTTTLPAIALNRERDQRHFDLKDEQRRLAEELERLRAKESAITDPIELERDHRARYGALGLPSNEILVPLDDAPSVPAPPPAPDTPRPGG